MLHPLDSAVCISGHGFEPPDFARCLVTPLGEGVARGRSRVGERVGRVDGTGGRVRRSSARLGLRFRSAPRAL